VRTETCPLFEVSVVMLGIPALGTIDEKPHKVAAAPHSEPQLVCLFASPGAHQNLSAF
jgi:hypothetical protein